MRRFYIADLHFGHANIIRYDDRPFASVEEMDEAIIANWNRTVSKDDIVYILGDLSWHKDEKTAQILNRLPGSKFLIRGNHDKLTSCVSGCFEKVCDYLEVKDSGEKVVLCHYPMPFWNNQMNDTVHLYGHVHNTEQWDLLKKWQTELRVTQQLPMRMYNVGCMMEYIGYTPRTLEEILAGGHA